MITWMEPGLEHALAYGHVERATAFAARIASAGLRPASVRLLGYGHTFAGPKLGALIP
jgi:hypothetical protein